MRLQEDSCSFLNAEFRSVQFESEHHVLSKWVLNIMFSIQCISRDLKTLFNIAEAP